MTSTLGRSRPLETAVGRGDAHAKVILFGEHSVVYGGPAIALPMRGLRLTASARATEGPASIESALYTGPIQDAPPRLAAPIAAITESLAVLGRSTADIAVRVDGRIPAGRGLGSSAAVAAAISASIADWAGIPLADEVRFELVQAAERVAHGNPSGLDARGVVADTPIWFRAGTVRAVPVHLPTAFVVADSGIPGGTREAVSAVAELRRQDEDRVTGILARIDTETDAAERDLAAADVVSLGRRMTAVHALLRQLSVSSPELDGLVGTALAHGALGAKLTGGGRGGCIIALADAGGPAVDLASMLRRAGAANTWIITAEDLAA